MDGRNPALERLDVLVGRWTVQPKVEGVGTSWSEFSWLENGAFLRQESDTDPMPPTTPKVWQENSPFPTIAIVGLDDADNEFTMLYADARGVHRVYRMTFIDNVWTMWREAPGFNQRFTGRISEDGDVIDGQWEMSKDSVTWNLDFEITYTRVS